MKKTLFFWLILLTLIFSASGKATAATDEPGWEVVEPGIEFRKYDLPDPNDVFVVRMYRNNPDVTLESSIAQGKVSGGLETVSGMYARYDQALSLWGIRSDPWDWGMRNQVVVAINGDYTNDDGSPQGGQISSGWYAKRFQDYGGRTGFAWKLDRSAFIGECVYHIPDKQMIAFPETGNALQFDGINRTGDDNELILFTPQFDTRTPSNDTVVEVLVEMSRPTMILPYKSAYASGYVRDIQDHGDNLIPFNYIVLSAQGAAADVLKANTAIGKEIQVSQELTSYSDCASFDWTKTYASIQGDYYFLKGNVIQDYSDPGATNYHPRTAIAYNDLYVFFIVVDGRHRDKSIGMTIHDLAVFSRDTLGASWGVAEDGGGSSTMVIHGQVINNTNCNQWGCRDIYIPLIARNTDGGQSISPGETEGVITATKKERPVPNGMLMVIVQPGIYSPAFSPGEAVMTTKETRLRLGPGTNYPDFTTIPAGVVGTIKEQMNGLEGVLAKSAYWWYVAFPGGTGWVEESTLSN